MSAPTRGRAVDARQEKVAGEYVTAVRAMDRKYVGTPEGSPIHGPTQYAFYRRTHRSGSHIRSYKGTGRVPGIAFDRGAPLGNPGICDQL